MKKAMVEGAQGTRRRGWLLIAVLALGLAACGGSQSGGSSAHSASVPTTESTPTTPTVAQATGTAPKAAKVKQAKRAKASARSGKPKHDKSSGSGHHKSASSGHGSTHSSSATATTPSASAAPAADPAATPPPPAPSPSHTARPKHTSPAKPATPTKKKPSPPSGPLVATLHASGHKPKVGHWPITVTLTKGGQGVRGHISYEFRFNGQVVSRQKVAQPPIPPGGAHSPKFVGRFHDVLTWPARAAGIPLTLRVVVTSPYGTKNLDWAVTVQK